MSVHKTLETRCLSSLSKVFPDQELLDPPFRRASALLNETYSFQIAYRPHPHHNATRKLRNIRIRIESLLEHRITVRQTGLVPSELPCYPDHDEHVLRTEPGLYPDPLYPISASEGISAIPGQWRALWVGVALNGSTGAGLYPVRIAFENESGETLADETFELELITAVLPEQKLIHTEWLHADCLAVQYETDIFSEAHWELIRQYAETAVRHGVNMLLTPLFTPPLDTKIGGERPVVQLVDVYKSGGQYEFGFDRLRRWVDMCNRVGIPFLEFSHLFTQWGAKHAPKIMAYDNGVYTRLFGWETDATGEAYREFLSQFLPALVRFLKDNDLEKRCYFHISDEPHLEHLPWYRSAEETIRPFLQGFPVIDALSDYEFYERGFVKNPIPATDRIRPFLEAKVPNLWIYYCCSQYKSVSNRFFGMPSARNRILGIQLYKYEIAGFLHWGYNFWFTQYSVRPIDPFAVTDADCAFPSGDAFLVYPGANGPVESVRMEVLFEALQDFRALTLLESKIGRAEVLELLEEGLSAPITFDEYPRETEWLLALREKVNRRIGENLHLQNVG